MSKRFTLCLVAAALLTGCGKSPVGVLGAKSVAKHTASVQPTVKVVKGEEFAADLNDHRYDASIATARQAIAGEFTAQGLALPPELATRQLQAAGGASVVSVKVVKGPLGGTLAVGKVTTPKGTVGVIAAKGPLGGGAVVVGAKGTDGSAALVTGAKDAFGNAAGTVAAKDGQGNAAVVTGAKDMFGNAAAQGVVKGANGGTAAFQGVQGANGAAAGVVAGKDAQGNAALVMGGKDAQGNAAAQGVVKTADGGTAAFQAVQGANGAAAGRWIASDGQGGGAIGGAATDAQGNAIATQVSTKDGKVVAQRWLKGANGDMVHETATFDPRTRLLTYEITAVINGQTHTGTCTVLIPA